MNIDDLKSNWNSISFPPGYGGVPETAELMSRVRAGRVSTLRDRLASISFALTMLCLMGVLIMVPYFAATPTLAILAICFFIFIGSLHLRNYLRVRRLNFSIMSVREALAAVCAIETSRVRLKAIAMTLAFPLLLYMCSTFSSLYGHLMFYGCLAGGVIGATIGFFINRKSMTIIREMRRQLSDSEATDKN